MSQHVRSAEEWKQIIEHNPEIRGIAQFLLHDLRGLRNEGLGPVGEHEVLHVTNLLEALRLPRGGKK